MPRFLPLLSAFLIFVLIYPVSILFAQDADTSSNRARAIYEEMEDRQANITYEQAYLKMVIYDSRGRTRTRELNSYSYTAEDGDTEKSLLVFEAPASVRGTAFLNLSEDGQKAQKLYLPALSRVQTITAAEQGDRFMGSDFTYEDLSIQQPDDFDFELLEESKAENRAVLKAVKRENSQYAYIHFYIDTNRYVLTKAEYFNNEDKLIKRLEAGGHTEVEDGIWLAGNMTMYDLQEDRKTELSWSDRIINEPIPDWRFTERGLRRN